MSKIRIAWAAISGFLNPFGSVIESVAEYALGVLNNYISSDNVSGKISECYATATSVLSVLQNYADWCPAKWRTQYDDTVAAVKDVVETFADGKVEIAEIERCKTSFQKAYAAWMAD